MLKRVKRICLLAAGSALGLGIIPLDAQTNVSVSDQKEDSSRILSTDQVDQELNTDGASLFDSLRANRSNYPKLSPEIRERLLQFQRQRDLYLKEQEELIKKFKGATEAERDRIRSRLREQRLEWLERSHSYREAARERLRDLLRELPKHQEALEAVQESLDEKRDEIRKRPRTD